MGFHAPAASAQANEWNWLSGTNALPASDDDDRSAYPGVQIAPGIFGTLGAAAAGNVPPGRESATMWTDGAGNFWLFGGDTLNYGSNGMSPFLTQLPFPTGAAFTPYVGADLWKFNPSTSQWAWVSGCGFNAPSTTCNPAQGVYGTLATPAPGNYPGQRTGAMGWVSGGDLWLFGGLGVDSAGTVGLLNDLWKFDPSTAQWTWMGGSNTVGSACPSADLAFVCGTAGTYGTQGATAPGNLPGSRDGSATWTDNSGNFWLFGGDGFDSAGNYGGLNDLWQYDVTANVWTWVNGSSVMTVCGGEDNNGACDSWYQTAVLGTQGVPAAANTPGSRVGTGSWTDSSGNLWLLNDDDVPNNSAGPVNDVWKFDVASKQWAWLAGHTVPGAAGNAMSYGTLGVPASGYAPYPRGGAVPWKDTGGNFWLYGGNATGDQELSDLWVFNPTTAEWAWMGGDAGAKYSTGATNESVEIEGQPGAYVAQGVASPDNQPGSRVGPAGWTDASGNFWLFGGQSLSPDFPFDFGPPIIVYLNDLWKLTPSATTLPPAVAPYVTQSSESEDDPLPVTIADDMSNAAIYYTTDGSTPTTNSTPYTGVFQLSSTATVKAIAVAAGYANSGVTAVTLTVIPPVAPPVISPGAGSYSGPQTVTITDATPNTTIYYTRDGTLPTTSSAVYSAPITIGMTQTLVAVAMSPGLPESGMASAAYYLPASFALSISPAALTIQSGQQITTTVTVTPKNGFDRAITFSCSGLTSGNCTFNPATVVPSGAAISTTLTLTTAAGSSALHRGSSPLFPQATLVLAACALMFRKKRGIYLLPLVIAVFGGLGTLSACGGSSQGTTGPTSVTSTITVIATSDEMQQSQSFTLTMN